MKTDGTYRVADVLGKDTVARLEEVRMGAERLSESVAGVLDAHAQQVSEKARLTGDFITLVESGDVAQSGRVRLKVIQPGWGSSGFYSAEMLRRDGPVAFPAETQQFWDHPTESAQAERPERSLRDLAAVLTSPAVFDEQGPHGPGLYADAQVFEPYRKLVEELAPHIGVSIHAPGEISQGEAQGRAGVIVEKLLPGGSIDFVTQPGAGGKVAKLFESARHDLPSTTSEEDKSMEEKERKELQERLAKVEKDLAEATTALEAERVKCTALTERAARAEEAVLLKEAATIILAVVDESDLPDVTKQRLRESGVAISYIKESDGQPVKLDVDKIRADATAKVAQESAYLAELSGAGVVRDQGGTSEATEKEAVTGLVESYKRLGLTDDQAKVAAEGRR